MSTREELKEYLLGKDEAIGYLLNDDNNGKTVMLSGAWGSGKTHFWQNDIEGALSTQLKTKEKACVYVSLYGKDNIEAIKNEILFKAYESIKDENKIAKRAISAFGFTSRLLSVSYSGARANTGAVGDAVENFFESKKINEAESFLADGGLICLDDFERKSKHIDLNDLFGFIAQLAIDLNCKVVIILNSDVFEGEEANVFKTVKEKTVNKFFYFEPTIEELFKSIYNSDEKYNRLDDYKDEIFKAIIETKEKNARIYIQILDNCLEWLGQHEYSQYELRALVLITTNFIQNHFVFTYRILENRNNIKFYTVLNRYYQKDGLLEIAEYFVQTVPQISSKIDEKEFKNYLETNRNELPVKLCNNHEEFLHHMYSSISKKNIEKKTDKKNDKETTKENTQSESYYERLDEIFHENKNIFYTLYFYAYVINIEFGLDKKKFDEINQFIKTGILPKNPKEVESSLPLKAN